MTYIFQLLYWTTNYKASASYAIVYLSLELEKKNPKPTLLEALL